MTHNLKLLGFLSILTPLFAGAQTEDVPDTPWPQRDRQNMKPLPYDHIREADVMWSKKIWRTIDVREKMNLPFAYPQHPLIEILHTAALRGDLTAYDASVEYADQFRKVLPPSDIAKEGVSSDSIEVINPETGLPEMKFVSNPLTWNRITKYKIKEQMFFDTKTSTMQIRIIGIAPVMEDYDATGNYRGDMTMYWLYYPDLRDMLSKQEAFNPGNDQKSLSWDDIFESRRFESYIYKESNIYDRSIAEYATGKDMQLESERIKQKNMEFEHDLWDY